MPIVPQREHYGSNTGAIPMQYLRGTIYFYHVFVYSKYLLYLCARL